MPEHLSAMIGVDMETDVGSWTPFYEGLVHGTPRLLEVFDKRAITGTFYFTAASVRAHPEVARAVADAGHEIGCHTLFHETIGDPIFDIPGMAPVLPHEVEPRLKLATEWIENEINIRPAAFRAPRLFGSTAMVNALDNLGYLTDASYPMYHYRDRLTPYHPSRDDWTQQGDLRITELPNFADLSQKSEDPFGRDLDQWPRFRTESADAVLQQIDGYSDYARSQGVTPFLCFYFHPWEFHDMPQGEIHYGEGAVRPDPFIVKNCGDYALQQFDRLLGQLLERGTRFWQARDLALS